MEYDISGINWIFKRVWKMVDSDPLHWASEELWDIEQKFTEIHSAIKSEWDVKSRNWIISSIFSKWVGGTDTFKYWNFEWKVTAVFAKYDLIHSSIKNIWEMYEILNNEISLELEKLTTFLNSISPEELEWDDVLQYNTYKVMQANLELSLQRTTVQLNTCNTLDKTMWNNRPTFEVILSNCLLEVAWNKTIESSAKIISIMSTAIDGLSSSLTEQTISQSKWAILIGNAPALSISWLVKSKLLLEWAIEEIKETRKIAYIQDKI